MSGRYSMADVLRWQQLDEGRLQMKLSQLGDASFAGRRDFVLSGLHLLHEGLGYTYVALNRPKDARLHFLESCRYVKRIFELPTLGESVSSGRLSAGYCMSWLIALAIKEDGVALSLAELFLPAYVSADKGQASIEGMALALQSLIAGDADSARKTLADVTISESDDLKHYIGCLEKLAERDEERFLESLDLASRVWLRQIVKTHQGLPQSVCWMQGLGLLRLAERVLGKPMDSSNELIPARFFEFSG